MRIYIYTESEKTKTPSTVQLTTTANKIQSFFFYKKTGSKLGYNDFTLTTCFLSDYNNYQIPTTVSI